MKITVESYNLKSDKTVQAMGSTSRTITDNEIIHAMKRPNNRPGKRLGYKTPNEVIFGMESTVALTT